MPVETNLVAGQCVKCVSWDPKRGVPQWMSGKVCVVVKVGRTRAQVKTGGNTMSVPMSLLDITPRCTRCHKAAVVNMGDGSGIFPADCIEKRCRRTR